jgi:hydroxymethylbilane synthase
VKALRIGTRGSALALWQARAVAARLAALDVATDLVVIRTAGDRLQSAPLSDAGGKRLFVKEIQEALLDGTVDIAVHSAKDMPSEDIEGLAIAAVLPRGDPRDALVLPAGAPAMAFDAALAAVARSGIGTGSVRRVAQLKPWLPHAVFGEIRGNVDTRLRALDAGAYGALVLAAAGLLRLGLGGRITASIPIDRCVPAPGQGIVAIETREGDAAARTALAAIDDRPAAVCLEAERAVVRALGGGCQIPLGAIAMHEGATLRMIGIVASPDGAETVTRRAEGPAADAPAIAARLAGELARGGAGRILDRARLSAGRQP